MPLLQKRSDKYDGVSYVLKKYGSSNPQPLRQTTQFNAIPINKLPLPVIKQIKIPFEERVRQYIERKLTKNEIGLTKSILYDEKAVNQKEQLQNNIRTERQQNDIQETQSDGENVFSPIKTRNQRKNKSGGGLPDKLRKAPKKQQNIKEALGQELTEQEKFDDEVRKFRDEIEQVEGKQSKKGRPKGSKNKPKPKT